MKKLTSTLLTLSFIGSMAISAYAEPNMTLTENGWEYQPVGENSAKLIKLENNDTLIIPENIGQYKITEFHMGAFMGIHFKNCDLSAFPNLSPYMFANSFLENVTLSKELKNLPAGIFAGTNIKNIILPEGLESIESGAFAECSCLEEIVIPKTVSFIDKDAFMNTPKLWKATFSEGITSIGTESEFDYDSTIFSGNNLKVVVIPESVTYIAPNEFKSSTITEGHHNYMGYPEGLAFYGKKDSYAHKFALENNIKFYPVISVTLNGNKISFDQPPIIKNNSTLVPFRAIFDALGAEIEWNETLRAVKATKDSTTVIIEIGKNTMLKNGERISLETPSEIINNRTLVPVRAVTEAFGNDVDWDSENMTVIIK